MSTELGKHTVSTNGGVAAGHLTEASSQQTVLPNWNNKRKERSYIARTCTWIVDNQISISVSLISCLFLTHYLFPEARPHTQKFFRISYFNPNTGRYAIGWDDTYFVSYWILIFTGLRCAVMDYILYPFAGYLGLRKKKIKVRFAEQAWMIGYYTVSWCTGMHIMYHSDYWLNLRGLWRNYPVREMESLLKWYYMVQFAFWLQQIIVVNIEERRKDYLQMFFHHVITCTLIFTSYGYHYYKIGTLILCLMDPVDILLPLAKILNYLHYRVACDITFGLFMVVWLFTRHVLFSWVLWSIYAHVPEEMTLGCWTGGDENLVGPFPAPERYDYTTPFRDPVGLLCYTKALKYGFSSLLVILQAVLLGWFYLIVRVAYRVLLGKGADDSRSDDEDEEEEIDEHGGKGGGSTVEMQAISHGDQKAFIEKQVSSTDTNFNSSFSKRGREAARSPVRRSSRRKGDGSSTGVNILNGSSDRKELLGRIGCDKPSSD